MTNLCELLNLPKQSDTITIEATVDTGFECMAEEEFRSKFGSDLPVCCDRGRIYFNIASSQYPIVKTLRSVNNVKLVVDYFRDINLLSDSELMEANAHNLKVIGELTKKIEWNRFLDFWKDVMNFEGVLYPSRDEYLEAVKNVESGSLDQQVENDQSSDDSTRSCKSSLSRTGLLRYRVTCYRSGKHTFGSQDAARSFGGQLQDMFHWVVNLDEFHLEVVLQVRDNDAIILISLTESSMHKRNIIHYGLTTLRSTIAFNMLQLVKPDVGDVVMDPMCGCGALPIEGAVGFRGTYHLCGDINERSVSLTSENLYEYRQRFEKNLFVDPLNWDVCCLPLRNASVDIVATDMPFGKRSGSKLNNRTLYVSALKELARVVRPTVGRMVLLTLDRTSYNMALGKTRKYWRQTRMMIVKVGGLKVCTYLLQRTSQFFSTDDVSS